MTHETCRQLLGSLSDYLDGCLDEDICALIEEHMESCDNCRVVLETLRRTVELAHETSTPAPLPEDVRARLFQCLNLEEYLPNNDRPIQEAKGND